MKSLNSWLLNLAVAIFASILLMSPRLTQCQRSRRQCFLKTHPPLEPTNCDAFSRYRTISGRCNNLREPEWGSAGSTMRRVLPPAYQDGRGVPRGGRHPSSLPNPRWISQRNHPDSDVSDPRYTHMVMQFGQFLDHDITLTPKDEVTNCCDSGVQGADCFTITIPGEDRFYSWVNSTAQCLNVLRSQPVCREKVRQQYNEITAFVDASNVYGSEQEQSAILRTYRDGRLHTNSNNDQLPTREQLNIRHDRERQRPERPDDFIAGDVRSNEQPFLTAMHVIFVREHNRIAKLLREYLPQELRKDEILYQEARRLVGAEMQNIAYGEYLPTILGVDYMQKYDLVVAEASKYDAGVDASIFNSFATSAFRFGHSMVNGMFKLVSQRAQRSRSIASKRSGSGAGIRSGSGSGGDTSAPLKAKDVFWLWRLREVFDGQSIRGSDIPLDNMIEGLITQEPQTCDAFFSTELTDHLFQKNHKHENFGEDLLAINIQRGREHGLPPYNTFRKWCGLEPLTTWSRVPEEHTEAYWRKLEAVYENVLDIDLYVGAIAERGVRGGAVGPTFACLIGEQFDRLKRGDRFFYTHTNANGLPPVAKEQILKRTFSDVLCDVTQIPKVQKWVTLQPNTNYNNYKSCAFNGARQLDMRAIANEIADELLNGDVIGTNNEVRSPKGRFPERLRSQSGRALRFNDDAASVNSAAAAAGKEVRFDAADAIARPPPRPQGHASSSPQLRTTQFPKFGKLRQPTQPIGGGGKNKVRFPGPPPPAAAAASPAAISSFIESKTRTEPFVGQTRPEPFSSLRLGDDLLGSNSNRLNLQSLNPFGASRNRGNSRNNISNAAKSAVSTNACLFGLCK